MLESWGCFDCGLTFGENCIDYMGEFIGFLENIVLWYVGN